MKVTCSRSTSSTSSSTSKRIAYRASRSLSYLSTLDDPQKMASTILPLGEPPSTSPPSVLPLFANRLTLTSISSQCRPRITLIQSNLLSGPFAVTPSPSVLSLRSTRLTPTYSPNSVPPRQNSSTDASTPGSGSS